MLLLTFWAAHARAGFVPNVPPTLCPEALPPLIAQLRQKSVQPIDRARAYPGQQASDKSLGSNTLKTWRQGLGEGDIGSVTHEDVNLKL